MNNLNVSNTPFSLLSSWGIKPETVAIGAVGLSSLCHIVLIYFNKKSNVSYFEKHIMHKYILIGSLSLIASLQMPQITFVTTMCKVISIVLILIGLANKIFDLGSREDLYGDRVKEENDAVADEASYSRKSFQKRMAMMVYESGRQVEFFATLMLMASLSHFLKKSITHAQDQKGLPLVYAALFYVGFYIFSCFVKLDEIERKYFGS